MNDYKNFKLDLQLFGLIHKASHYMEFNMMYDGAFFRQPSIKNFSWFSDNIYKTTSSSYISTINRLLNGKVEYVLFLIEVRDEKNKAKHFLEFRILLENSSHILNLINDEN